jgi:ABC-type nickel/cobalt efflux system permease component RcnA
MFSFPLLLTIYAGFTHAFEADHLLAVSNIVSQRNNIRSSMKDGVFWGLGHASTIFFIGILMILFKMGISGQSFHYFEAIVGVMLIALAVYRLTRFFRSRPLVIHAHEHSHGHTHDTPQSMAHPSKKDHPHRHLHVHVGDRHQHRHTHSLAYSVGLIHGLAGSGALILVVMSRIKGPIDGLLYLLIFGIGCMAGMLVAAGLFSVPFSKKVMQGRLLQRSLIIISSTICLLYGGKVIFENLID